VNPFRRQPRLVLPGPGGGIGTGDLDDLAALDATRIALLFELLEADITIDGLQIRTEWLVTSQLGSDAEAQRQARLIDQAISHAYPPERTAALQIQGLTRAVDAVRWLRALRLRSYRRPSQHTQLALIKS
jgi:hypothetical protein